MAASFDIQFRLPIPSMLRKHTAKATLATVCPSQAVSQTHLPTFPNRLTNYRIKICVSCSLRVNRMPREGQLRQSEQVTPMHKQTGQTAQRQCLQNFAFSEIRLNCSLRRDRSARETRQTMQGCGRQNQRSQQTCFRHVLKQ